MPALCNLSCFGVEMSIQFSRRDHYQWCLLPRSCIVKTSKQVHTDRCIQIIGHQCVLLDIFTVLNQQTRTSVSVPYLFCSTDWEPVHHLQHAQEKLPPVDCALQHKHQLLCCTERKGSYLENNMMDALHE